MNSFTNLFDVSRETYKKRKQCPISDTIYTFDIETTSLFNYEGVYNVFDYSKPKEYYSNVDKVAIPYIWQFGVEDNIYYGRDFMDFEKVLKTISDKEVRKVIWVHNLSYEFGFLPNILRKYTITDMVARDTRKPISFVVKELNIMFRCSYMLTNLSLAKASQEYTNVQKLDTLDYDAKIRTPLTPLTDNEMKYCAYDIKCLYEIIKYYRTKYEHIALIPLTSTAEVRQALREVVDYYYIKKQWELVPQPKMYLRLMASFAGGYTHANVLNAGRVFKNVKSYDISSSYPFVMVTEMFPCTPFMYISYEQYQQDMHNPKCGFILHVTLKGVKSKYYNNYIAFSRCENVDTDGIIYDNGRIRSCKECSMWLTNIDLNIILKNYDIDKVIYNSIYMCYMDYLDIRVIKFILGLYGNKTTLKNVEGKEDIYKKSKAYINSLYGCSVTNPLKNSTIYEGNMWSKKEFTMDFVKEVLANTKKSYSTLFYYAVGVFVTAYARRNLYERLISSHEFDRHVIYCDTDSIKYYGEFDYIFEEYNKGVFNKYKTMCQKFSQLNLTDFTPKDRNGIKHPIGIFDYEGEYLEFKTLGAKKYCYRDDTGLHITVSGVSKNAVIALNDDINNFRKGLEFDYKQSGKLTHYYMEEQPHINITDDEGNTYHSNIDYGVVLQPTTYTMGVTDVYETLIDYFMDKERRTHE